MPPDQTPCEEPDCALHDDPGAAKAYAVTHRILCAHADDRAPMHWLEPGETCPLTEPRGDGG